jgi:hypothetical protein
MIDACAGIGCGGFSDRFDNAGRDGEFVHEDSILRFVQVGALREGFDCWNDASLRG